MHPQPDLSVQDSKLSYHLAEKHDILVVSLVGIITKSSEEVLRRCTAEIEKSGARSVVLNFLGVEKFEKAGVPEFTKLQLLVRRKPAELRICFIRPAVVEFLTDAGVIRPAEVSKGLKEAIVGLAFKRVAA